MQKLLVDLNSAVTGTFSTTPARAGDNLVLSVDTRVQKVVETALAGGIMNARTQTDPVRGTKYAAPNGAAIVLEATTGRVVAMASYPSYDPTVFVGGISTREYAALLHAAGQPLISSVVQGLYAPGSTFKIVSTAAAIGAGYPLTARIYDCPSSFMIGNSAKHNFEGEAPGVLDFHETLVRSCDTVYYKLAYDEWVRDGGLRTTGKAKEAFATMAKAFGFGRATGIDLPDERSGLITDRAFKKAFWEKNKADYCKGAARRPKGSYLQQLDQEFCADGYRLNGGDAANFIIGQGDVLATPLQLASAYAALVNGGTLYRPQLAKGLLSADGKTATALPPTKVGRLPVAQPTLDYIRNALAGVVLPPGTAQSSFAGFPLSQLPVGGKTGTADVNDKAPTSWFASFAPVDHSKYVTVVMVPEGGTGGSTAAPIARKIWDGMYGLEGAQAVLSNGSLPVALPVVRPDGTVAAPGTKVPVAPRVVVSSSSTGTRALGGLPLPWAEAARRLDDQANARRG
ncbi:MAG: penicillin-binding protein 2 [Frankiales bacterium]|nr:penicillin-binding protein 2 [Frankiales bacterium]